MIMVEILDLIDVVDMMVDDLCFVEVCCMVEVLVFVFV